MSKYTQAGFTTNEARVTHDFGVCDRFGRSIGAVICTYEIDYVPAPADATYGYTYEPGHYFGLKTFAQRGGKGYGAWTPSRLFKARDERDTAAAKYLKDASKRAAKRAGK